MCYGAGPACEPGCWESKKVCDSRGCDCSGCSGVGKGTPLTWLEWASFTAQSGLTEPDTPTCSSNPSAEVPTTTRPPTTTTRKPTTTKVFGADSCSKGGGHLVHNRCRCLREQVSQHVPIPLAWYFSLPSNKHHAVCTEMVGFGLFTLCARAGVPFTI